MTSEQKIKHAILLATSRHSQDIVMSEIYSGNIDEKYNELADIYDGVREAADEFRSGQVETGIKCDWSRHYESKSVAAKMPDGTWVGWTYWYGGGKHGEPESIDWMNEAYALSCTEEEKLVTVRTFVRVQAA